MDEPEPAVYEHCMLCIVRSEFAAKPTVTHLRPNKPRFIHLLHLVVGVHPAKFFINLDKRKIDNLLI